MWVKICATTNVEDALLAVDAGADAVGFVFAQSKRQVTPEQVAAITPLLPASVEKVGVFATNDPSEVEHYVARSGLTVAQLHRPFHREFVQALSGALGRDIKVIQTVAYEVNPTDRPAADRRFVGELQSALAEPAIWAVLLDAAKGGVSGGQGAAFDWEHVAPLVQTAYGAADRGRELPKLIVAGGLRPDNVGKAIRRLKPWGVDVASGVEEAPGRKDDGLVRSFIAAARQRS